MKKYFYLLISVFLLAISSCQIDDSSATDPMSSSLDSNNDLLEHVDTYEFVMTNDYGLINEDKVTLLYGYSYFSGNIDLSMYELNDLKAGDTVKIHYTGELIIYETYPGTITIENGNIIDIEVFKAKEVDLTVYPVPGGGYDILTDDYSHCTLPEYFVYGDNFASTNMIYDNLKFIGTIPYNSETNDITALYAIDYDPTKVEDNKHDEFVSNDQTLNEYFEDFINAISYNKEGNYRYSIYAKDLFYKNYIKVDDVEYIHFYDLDKTYNLNGCLVELYPNKYAINTGKVRYEEECNNNTLEYYRNYYYTNEERIIQFYNDNKPLTNNGVYGSYKIYIEAIDPCCGGPVYVVFDDLQTSGFDIKLEVATNMLDYSNFFDDRNSVTAEQYVENMDKTASLITFDGNYRLLSKIDGYPDKNDYIVNPGFGIYTFAENKYDFSNDFCIMHFSVTRYPDYGFSLGQYITRVYISDKDVIFNGLTLKNSFAEITDEYKSLGFVKKQDNGIYEIYSKDGVSIMIAKDCSFISFQVGITNLQGIVY